MKLKIIAQRKFAQGIPAPSSNSTTNTTVEKKTADLTKDLSNVFHNNTSATKLLDLVSFDGIHTHNPYVRVERLKNITKNNLNLIMEASSTRDMSPTSRSLESRYRESRRMSLSQNLDTMILRSGSKVNNTAKKSTAKGVSKSHLSIKKRRNPTRKAAFLASFCWKLISSDTEFSVDDDKPLAYFTRAANQKMSNQTQEGSSSKNYNKSGPISREHGNLRISVDEGTSENCSTVSRITREAEVAASTSQKISTPGKKRNKNKTVELDEFDICAVRNKIHEMYTVRKEVPTLNKLLIELRNDLNFKGGRTTLWKILQKNVFKFKKCGSKRKLLMERHDIVAWRHKYIKILRENRHEGRPVIFLDETYINSTYSVNKCWQSDDEPGVSKSDSTGARWIIISKCGW